MPIPQNITKEHLLRAIEKIDKEGVPINADSKYYDVVFNQKKYPPKLIISYANLFANGIELNRNSFEGGLGTPCFKLLEEKGFSIIKKTTMIIEKIKTFSEIYKNEILLPHNKELKSFKLLVNELPKEIIEEVIEFSDSLIAKGSIGQGVNTYYPWIAIFDNRVSSGATNGFYVVLLFSDDFEDVYLTLNQGSTIQSTLQVEAYRNFVYKIHPQIEGFEKGKIPEGGLVKKKFGSAAKNGKKYEESNIFYRKYDISSLNESDFINHLKIITKAYVECAEKYSSRQTNDSVINSSRLLSEFQYGTFFHHLENSGIKINSSLVVRFACSLLSKPFVILTGLSGSGKTKLAQAFAKWICEDESQYCMIPVGADWTNREPLLGFPNALKPNDYVRPDNRVLDLIIDANNNQNKPFFMILDEMNLSHVERYFADFLSVMESKENILLHPGPAELNGVPAQIGFPKNLFIIGTVNIDETTYMFSPKVLDRASVIEFRVTKDEMENYLKSNSNVNLQNLESEGANMAESFVAIANDTSLEVENPDTLNTTLLKFFSELKKNGAEFGYRSASEILRFAAVVKKLDVSWNHDEIADVAIMQKLLPKVHGSRKKLEPVLKKLGTFCLNDANDIETLIVKTEIAEEDILKIKYPLSFEKIQRMYQNLISNGFTSYAEA